MWKLAPRLALNFLLATAPLYAGTWTGSGGAGSDPNGNPWLWTSDGFSIPGSGQGAIQWNGPDTGSVSFNFSNLPPGLFIDSIDSTFQNLSIQWFVSSSSNAITFTAPAGSPITSTGLFFTQVYFNQPVTDPSGISFTADYVETTASPEPSPLLSLGLVFAVGLSGFLNRTRVRPQ